MARRFIPVLVLSCVLITCASCRIGRVSFGYEDDRPRRVTHVHRVPTHVCTTDCHRHYWDGTRVIVLSKGHHHGSQCGHHWDGVHWVVARKARAGRVRAVPRKVLKTRHTHGASCGCAFDRRGHKWLKVGKSHLHRRGCGHVFIEGRWSIRH